MTRIGVFPAAGKLGLSISNHLANTVKVDPGNLVLIARSPGKIPGHIAVEGVETRRADYDDPSSMVDVFKDVDCLVLISYPSMEHEHRFEAHKAAIDAATATSTGPKHIFYTSLAFGGNGSPSSVAHVMQAHLTTEKYIASVCKARSSKLTSYTHVREGIYSESWPMYLAFVDPRDPPADGVVRMPHDGLGHGIAWVKIDELGEGTARLVERYMRAASADSFEHTDRTVVLGGSRAWSLKETLDAVARVAGRDLRVEECPLDEYAMQPAVQSNLAAHAPQGDVPIRWGTMYEAVRRGECAVESGLLQELLGREPEAFETTLRSLFSR